MYCIAVSILIGLFSHKKEIIALMYPNTDSTYSAKVFGLLLFNFFPIALLYVIGTLLTANKNFKQMIIVLSVAVLINVGLNFILIVKSGAEGAAIATLITQVFMLIAYSVLIMRIFNISFNINYVLRLLSFSVLCLLLVLLTKQLQLQNSKLQLLFQLCGFFICIPILGWISGLLNKEMLHLTFSRMD
ncbi:MAG TPA: polysaccharide biosynthesis C-terminal domain-containing protein, partial [Chitinophagales bacterium]|nr:polysaccharide biosynthesis C-terminal domain-containing protein [Chitinophagales bacterium]